MKIDINLKFEGSQKLVQASMDAQSKITTEMAKTLNTLTPKIRNESVTGVTKKVKLSSKYVDSKVKFEEATNGKLTAIVATPIKAVRLAEYPGHSKHTKNAWDLAKFTTFVSKLKDKRIPMMVAHPKYPSKRLRSGPYVGWVERKGRSNAKVKIPAGYKQAGLLINVKSGGKIETAFYRRLKNSNAWGVFTRGRNNTLKHRYGTAIYHVIQDVWRDNESKYQDRLNSAVWGKMRELKII